LAANGDVLSVRFSRRAETVVVHLIGELDVVTAPALQQALSGMVEDQGNLAVQLDLCEMAFIDSTGLSVLAGALRRLREKGGDLTLVNVRPETLKVFDIVGFTRIFNIAPEPTGLPDPQHATKASMDRMVMGPHTLGSVA
jgi:anti-sigma B factor antagonist